MKKLLINLSLSVFSFIFTFVLLECAARVYKKEYHWRNFLEEKWNLFRSAYPVQYDTLLGWIPKEHFSGYQNVWETQVTLNEHGIRSNGMTNIPDEFMDSSPVLVVGDSFTFGDQVSDHETWPAILERLIRKRVINAGVFGYGIDQSFLRAEKLSEIYQPEILIFSFIPDDIKRCELSERTGVAKPYYHVSDRSPRLHNVPVPPPPERTSITGIRRILGHSFLLHKLMMRSFPNYWLQGSWNTTREHDDGEEIACFLFQKLEQIAKENEIKKVFLLVQYLKETQPHEYAAVDRLIDCVDQRYVSVIDLRPVLNGIINKKERTYQELFDGLHMSYQGNDLVARTLRDAIFHYPLL